MQVITKAIEVRRETLYNKIKEAREKAKGDMAEYPVEAAVKDALVYHSACSLLTGLEEAGASIERAKDLGNERLKQYIKSYKGLQKELQTPSSQESGGTQTPSVVRSD